VVDDVIKWVMLYIESVLEKHKVDDAVTVDKKRDNNNDIQGSEEEDKHQQQPTTTSTVF
jgi:hypothetical protein